MGNLYDQDFIGWTEQQARVLREAAASRSNLELDWENLIEEVEALGRSQYDALASQIRRLVLHLLKLEFSPASAPRAGWLETVANARAEIRGRLRRDPGLKSRIADIIHEECPVGAGLAVQAMRAYGEDPAGVVARQCAREIYAQDQILGDWLPGDPAA